MSTRKRNHGPHGPSVRQIVRYEEVPVAGQVIRLEHANIPIERLELDPDNPRIRYRLGINPGTDARQELLGWRDVLLLRKDIERSGGLRERIVVQFDKRTRKFKVREGNCRTVCYGSLHEKSPKDKRWQTVPAKVLPEDVDPRAVAILLADWQVVGKLDWKAHEKAAQIGYMNQQLKMPMDEIAMHMRASKTTIQRQLDAHRALTDRFFVIDRGKYASEGEGKWSFFEELFKNRELRERARTEADFIDDFCRWVGEGRLRQGADVRLLPRILNHNQAAERFFEGDRKTAFAEAKKIVAQSDPSIDSDLFRLFGKVREAVSSAATIKELLRIRQDEAARKQILLTYEKLVDFMRLGNLHPDFQAASNKIASSRPRKRKAARSAGRRRHS